MSERIRIRDAVESDAAAIQRVARRSWHAAYDSILGVETVTGRIEAWFRPETLVEDDIRPASRPLAVAEADDGVVGFVECVADDSPETYHLYRLYVAPARWGEGVGTKLLAWAERTARETGVERLRLSVLAENDAAIGFYEARGFERVATVHQAQFSVARYEYEKSL